MHPPLIVTILSHALFKEFVIMNGLLSTNSLALAEVVSFELFNCGLHDTKPFGYLTCPPFLLKYQYYIFILLIRQFPCHAMGQYKML